MAELEFERRLERLFAESAELPDAADFAERLARRLDRGWTARRWLIGAAGTAGGLTAASQLLLSGVLQRAHGLEASARLVGRGLSRSEPGQWIAALPAGGGVVWVAAGLAVVLIGFVLARVIEEF
jgi:hypothetical protein